MACDSDFALPLQTGIGESDMQAGGAGEVRRKLPEVVVSLDIQRSATEAICRQRKSQERRASRDLVDAHLPCFVRHQAAVVNAIHYSPIAPYRWPQMPVDDVAGFAGIAGCQQLCLHPFTPLLAGAQGGQCSLVAACRLRFQKASPVRDGMAGTELPSFFGLALLSFGMIAGSLFSDVAETVAAEDAPQAGQALLSQPVPMVVVKLLVIRQVQLAESFHRQILGGQRVRPLALERCVERPAPAWFGITGA